MRETDVIHQLWLNHELCANDYIRNEIEHGFNQFKSFLNVMKDKKVSLDDSVLLKEKTLAPSSSSFFYQRPSNTGERSSDLSLSSPSGNCSSL